MVKRIQQAARLIASTIATAIATAAATATVIVSVIVAVLGFGGGASAQGVTWSEDLPLMVGLVLDEDVSVVFDTPDGRVIEAVAQGAVSYEQALQFYRDTLPQLGWHRIKSAPKAALSFERAGEHLDVRLVPGSDIRAPLLVRLSLSPIS